MALSYFYTCFLCMEFPCRRNSEHDVFCHVKIVCPTSGERTDSMLKLLFSFLHRDEARDMFFHAYNAYMDNAFPADELMPLSCRGRYRGREPDRGDLDEAMGNFSVSLIDALDTLFLLGMQREGLW